MAFFSRPFLTREVEYTDLGQVGDRQLRGRTERRTLDLRREDGTKRFRLHLGRLRATAIDVYEPGQGHYAVPVRTPSDTVLTSLAAITALYVAAWGLGRLVARPRHTRRRR